MESKAADLTKIKVQDFVGVACKENLVYALTSDGLLYVLNENLKTEKWMNIKVNRAIGLTLSGTMLICACSDGIVRIFDCGSLSHVLTLPKPPPLGKANWLVGEKVVKVVNKDGVSYADAVALKMDVNREKLFVLYSDKMMLVWDMRNKSKISIHRSFLGHNGPIYDLKEIPTGSK